jgi:hypothetical protein
MRNNGGVGDELAGMGRSAVDQGSRIIRVGAETVPGLAQEDIDIPAHPGSRRTR